MSFFSLERRGRPSSAARAAFHQRLKSLSRTSHTYYFRFIDHGKSNALCRDLCNNRTTLRKQFHEIKTLRVMRGGYNMIMRCNLKFMFCEDRGIDFGVWLCRRYAQHFWEFPLYPPVLFGLSVLPPGTMGITTERKKVLLSNASTVIENSTVGWVRRDKNFIYDPHVG